MAGTGMPSSVPGSSPKDPGGTANRTIAPGADGRPVWLPIKVRGAKQNVVPRELAGFLRRLSCQRRGTSFHEHCLRPLGVNALNPELDVAVLARDPADPGIEAPATEQPHRDIGGLRHRDDLADNAQLPLGALVHAQVRARCGAIDGEVPVAAPEIQRPDNQEEGCPSVDAVREAHHAGGARGTAAENPRDPEGAEVAVLPRVDEALHAGSRGRCPPSAQAFRGGVVVRCVHWAVVPVRH